MNLFTMADLIGVKGYLHLSELEWLVALAAGRDVLEVGSFKGLSAWGMAITAKSVLCVDTFKADIGGQAQQEEYTTLVDFLDAVKRYKHVEYLAKTSVEASKIVDKTFDLIFVDAMHTYEGVTSDIEAWWPKVRTNGIMAFHDYTHPDYPDVQRAVEEKFGPLPHRVITLGWLPCDRRREIRVL